MSFRLPESYYEKQKELYEKKYILIDDSTESMDKEPKKVHVSELEDRSVTPDMRAKMRMNSYAQDDLPPKLTDEALIQTAEYYLSQCSRPIFPCSTYNDALIHKILPELLIRFKETQQ